MKRRYKAAALNEKADEKKGEADRFGCSLQCFESRPDPEFHAEFHVAAALKPILPKDTILCTDGSGTLAAAAKEIGVTHRPVNLSAGIRVIAGVYHVQNVNAYTPGSRIGYAASRACPHATSTAISAGSEPSTGRAAVR